MADARLIPRDYKRRQYRSGVFLDSTLGGRQSIMGVGLIDSSLSAGAFGPLGHLFRGRGIKDMKIKDMGARLRPGPQKSTFLDDTIGGVKKIVGGSSIPSQYVPPLQPRAMTQMSELKFQKPTGDPLQTKALQLPMSMQEIAPQDYSYPKIPSKYPLPISKFTKQSGLKSSQRKRKLRFKGLGFIDKLKEKIAGLRQKI
jgi:hypothetical protein